MIPLCIYWLVFVNVSFVTFFTWYGLSLITYQFFPIALVPGVLMALAIHILHIPQPSSMQVEKIIGKDLNAADSSTDNNNALMRTVAHRGAGLDAPENSLIAFKQCANQGCMYIEFDVMLSKDGFPVVFHDETLERMANDKRSIRDVNLHDLKLVDIGVTHPFSEKFINTQLPTLDNVIMQLLADGQKMFIDIKDNDYRMATAVLNAFEVYPTLVDNAIVTTFYPNLIYAIRKSNPKIVCALAYRPYFICNTSYSFELGPGPRRYKNIFKHCAAVVINAIHSWALIRITYYVLGLSVILLHKDCVSPEIIKEWRDRGVRPCIWTVNKTLDKQYITRTLQCTYFTDTLVGESNVHINSML